MMRAAGRASIRFPPSKTWKSILVWYYRESLAENVGKRPNGWKPPCRPTSSSSGTWTNPSCRSSRSSGFSPPNCGPCRPTSRTPTRVRQGRFPPCWPGTGSAWPVSTPLSIPTSAATRRTAGTPCRRRTNPTAVNRWAPSPRRGHGWRGTAGGASARPPGFPLGTGIPAAAGTWLARNGGGTLVLHTGFPLENWYPRRWGSFLGSLNELLDAVPGNVRFAVENTPIPSGRVEIVMDIVARYPEDRVGVCLDLGHAHIEGDVGNALRESAPRLIHVHASDNHGDRDDHLVPGRGGIPWKEVFAQLREIGFPGPFTVELRDTTGGDDPHDRSFEEILGECRSALASFQGEGGPPDRWTNGQSG